MTTHVVTVRESEFLLLCTLVLHYCALTFRVPAKNSHSVRVCCVACCGVVCVEEGETRERGKEEGKTIFVKSEIGM